jgi:TatD DNase family protein
MRGALGFELLRMPAPIVDIGFNIAHKDFQGDLKDVLARAAEANVTRLICTGTSVKSTKECMAIVAKFGGGPVALSSTCGVHPHDAKHYTEGPVAALAEKVPVVGECGIDFDRMFSPAETQKAAFASQLQLARRLNKPVFLHQRLGFAEFNEIMDAHWPAELAHRACVHCFTGDAKELKHFVAKGYFVGITGFVCKKNRAGDLRSALKAGLLPLKQLMIETDGPYMSPLGKVRRCEPAMLGYVARELAELMGVELLELCTQTTANVQKWLGEKP